MATKLLNLWAALAVLFVPQVAFAQQAVDLNPGASLTVNALADTVVLTDTLTITDTVVALDTVYACPPGWTCQPDEEPPVVAGPPPPPSGRPEFSEAEGGVRVTWGSAEGATGYRMARRGALDQVYTDTTVVLELADGDWVCVWSRANNEENEQNRCNSYAAPVVEPEPAPEPEPGDGNWTLLHEFSPAAGNELPSGVLVIEESGIASRESDHYLLRFPVGYRDGRGPGHVEIHLPPGTRSMAGEYDIELVPAAGKDWEDHPVYTKLAHYNTVKSETGHGAKYIDAFRNYTYAVASDSYIVDRREQLGEEWVRPEPHFPHYGQRANIAPEVRLEPNVRHTIRFELEFDHADVGGTLENANWYRIRTFIDGQPQIDALIPIVGGPDLKYWQFDPTFGGNTGVTKTQEDRMKLYAFRTWTR